MGWGPAGVFLLALVDSAGIPIPEGVDVLLVLMAATGASSAYIAAFLAIAGSAVGNMVLYYIARKGGTAYLDRQTRKGRARKLRDWFQQYGLLTVFIPTLIPAPLPTKVFVLSAGALGIRPVPFLLVVLAARIPRYFGVTWLGSQLGAHSWAWFQSHGWQLAGFAAVLFLALYMMVRLSARWRKPAGEIR